SETRHHDARIPLLRTYHRPSRCDGAPPMSHALVIGAGPAGLMAAEELSRAGFRVIIAEAKPSAGRKFLMAGKSGLNLTKAEPLPEFAAQFGAGAEWLSPM